MEKNYWTQCTANCTAALLKVATAAATANRLPCGATVADRRKAFLLVSRAVKTWERNNGLTHLRLVDEDAPEARVWRSLVATRDSLGDSTAWDGVLAEWAVESVRSYALGVTYGIDPYPRDIAKVVLFITR